MRATTLVVMMALGTAGLVGCTDSGETPATIEDATDDGDTGNPQDVTAEVEPGDTSDVPDAQPDADTSKPDGDTGGPDAADTPDVSDTPDTPDTPDVPDTTQPDYGLAVTGLSGTAFCPGEELTVDFELTFNEGLSVEVTVQLSGPGGGFGNPKSIGGATVSASGSIPVVLPGGANPGDGYRVRLVGTGATSEPSAETLTIHGRPELDVWFPHRAGGVGTVFTASNDTTGAAEYLWDLGDGADPATATGAEPSWTYDSTGNRTVTLTATSANGCVTSETFDSDYDTIRVYGCEVAIPGGVQVVKDVFDQTGGGTAHWVCFGGHVDGFGGSPTFFLEPGAHYVNLAASSLVFAKAASKAELDGGEIVFYEPGANVNLGAAYDAIECDAIVFDLANAPANGCTTLGLDPVTVTVGALPAGESCPQGPLQVPYSADGPVGANNVFVVELSDETGDFSSPTTIGELEGTATSGTIDATLPSSMVTSTAYKVRVVSTDPYSVGPTSDGVVSIGEALDPNFVVDDKHVTEGAPVTVTNTTNGTVTSVTWDFGPDATPSTSTDAEPVVSWSTPGVKTITMTATGPSGCVATRTKTPVTVYSCNPVAPSGAQRISAPDAEAFGGNASYVVCGGGGLELFGGSSNAYFKEGAVGEFSGGGTGHVFYVEGGAAFQGSPSSGGAVVVADDDAILYEMGASKVVTCTDLVIDDSQVGGSCAPFTPVEPGITLEAPASGGVCPGTQVTLGYTFEGALPPGPDVRLVRSDATGSFANPTVLATDYGAFQGQFTFNPGNPGAGDYLLRAEITALSIVSDPVPMEIYSRPTASYEVTDMFIMAGVTTTFINNSTGATSYEWTFPTGVPETSTDADPDPIVFPTPGTKYATLKATNDDGCSHTYAPDWQGDVVNVLSCNPVVPAGAAVKTGGGGLPNAHTLVCDGATASDGGGWRTVYIEPGGTFDYDGGGVYIAYVRAGATFIGGFGGLAVIVSEDGATLTSPNAGFSFGCPELTFDTSQLPAACP